MNWINKIHCGDALEVLKKMPSEFVNCVVTSPPYWALRDYGIDGQLGLEPTFDLYIKHLCDIFDEVKRVLRKDGTCWVVAIKQNKRSIGVEINPEYIKMANIRLKPYLEQNKLNNWSENGNSQCL